MRSRVLLQGILLLGCVSCLRELRIIVKGQGAVDVMAPSGPCAIDGMRAICPPEMEALSPTQDGCEADGQCYGVDVDGQLKFVPRASSGWRIADQPDCKPTTPTRGFQVPLDFVFTMPGVDTVCEFQFVPEDSRVVRLDMDPRSTGVAAGTIGGEPCLLSPAHGCEVVVAVGSTLDFSIPPLGDATVAWSGACSGLTGTSGSLLVPAGSDTLSCVVTIVDSSEHALWLLGEGQGEVDVPGGQPVTIAPGQSWQRIISTAGDHSVVLEALDIGTYKFGSWGVDCQGTDPHLQLDLTNTSKLCTVTFVPRDAKRLQVSIMGGAGSVLVSGDASGTCSSGTPCDIQAPTGGRVSLTASTDNPAFHFDHWEGDCRDMVATVDLVMDADKTCTAVFKSEAISVQIMEAPTAPVNPGTQVMLRAMVLNGVEPLTYAWSSVPATSMNPANAATTMVTVAANTTVTIRVTDGTGASAEESVEIVVGATSTEIHLVIADSVALPPLEQWLPIAGAPHATTNYYVAPTDGQAGHISKSVPNLTFAWGVHSYGTTRPTMTEERHVVEPQTIGIPENDVLHIPASFSVGWYSVYVEATDGISSYSDFILFEVVP